MKITPIKKIVETITGVTLELTVEETRILKYICGKVGGNCNTNICALSSTIYGHINSMGIGTKDHHLSKTLYVKNVLDVIQDIPPENA
jgi:hypothetical protein